MDRVRLALLNAAIEDAHTTRNFRRELDASLLEVDVTDGQLPPGFDVDGVVVTGSAASVYDDDPWIDATAEWVGEAIDRGLPALGVCWGHQLLADVLGGTVEPMGDFELGYSTLERVGDSRLLADLDDTFTAFSSHGDAVVDVPPGATPVARNEYGNQGFERDRVFTVQFHPEYDAAAARSVAASKDVVGADRRERVLAAISPERHADVQPAKRLLDAFVRYVDGLEPPDAAAD